MKGFAFWLLLGISLQGAPVRADLSFQAQLALIEKLSEQRQLAQAELALDSLRERAELPQERAAIDLEDARITLRRGQYLLAQQRMHVWLTRYQDQVDERSRVRAAIVLAQARFEQFDLQVAEAELQALWKLPALTDANLRAELGNALGAVQLYAGHIDAALVTLAEALAAASDPKIVLLRAQIQCWIAYAQLLRGDLAASEVAISEGLRLRQDHAPGSVSEAVARYFYSLVVRGRGDSASADAQLAQALTLLEAERHRQSRSGDTRAQWAAQFAFFYREAISRAADDADLPRAFALVQRFRSNENALDAPLDVSTTLRSARSHLRPGDTVLSFVSHDSHTFALLLTHKELHSFKIALGEHALREEVSALLMLIAARSSADIQALNSRSHRLYQQLIAPALALAPDTQSLLLQPDGALNELPFAALVSKTSPQRYLVEDLVPVLLSNAAVRPVSGVATRQLWVIADPQLDESAAIGWLRDGSRTRLPGANQEASAIAALYAPQATLLMGIDATEAAVKKAPPGVDLHFAMHMVRDAVDEQRSFLSLRASAAEDGELSVQEIARLRGSRDLVVLAGCASHRGSLAGGMGALGLARAWQQAGAQRVLASLWPLPDQPTAITITAFHQARRTHGDIALALAQAQRAWLAQTRDASWFARLSHWWKQQNSAELGLPFYWAALVVSE